MRVLYLEDSERDADFVGRYVKSLGIADFTAVNSCQNAVNYLQQFHPDIFLIDIVINGESATELIEFATQQGLAKYVIALTAKVMPSEVQQYEQLGCNYVIAKPFTINDLDSVFTQLA